MPKLVLLLAAALAISGCMAEVLTTTAVQGQLQAQSAGAAMRTLEYARESAGQTNLQSAINAYYADKGYYPPSLDALVPQYLASVPTQPNGTPYGYDAASGRISEVPAGGIAPQDYQTMDQIRAAINRFGTTTGYYPNTLDDLYPNYLATPPRTAAGEAFLYNNQNGEVTHPRAGQAPATNTAPRNAPTGGGSPMMETMTGIGIQNQLGNMSSGGANAAGTRSRGSVRGIASGHDAQQQQVMNNLGL
jgi:uncharacterized protein YceK